MLASELIFNIKNLKAGGIQSDDENVSDHQVAFIINYYRAKLMRQQVMKHNHYDLQDIQDLGRVEVIQTDPHECDCPGACILRTKLPIPSSMELNKSHGLTFVGQYGGMSFQEETWQSAPWSTYAPYTGNKTKWFIKGQYIYIINPTDPSLKYINIQGLFEDPKEANEFKTCKCDNGLVCNVGFDYEYPLSAHLVDTLNKMIMDSEIRWTTLLPQDTANDSLDTN